MSRRPYNVLLVDLAQAFGGAEVRVLTQAIALQERVAACRVAVLQDTPLHERLSALGLPCEVIAAGRGDPGLLFLLRDVIQRHNYAVVDAHNVQSILWAHWAAALAGAPGRVATIHSDYGAEYPGIRGWFYEGVLTLNRLVARHYITVTEVLQYKAETRGDGERSTLIHNAVQVADAPFAGVDAGIRGTLGYAADDFVLAIIARLKPVKGHSHLFDALALVKELPQVKLLVVGDGPLQPDLAMQAGRLGIQGRVQFAGFRDDVAAIMKAVDAVCMASLSEALPYAVLEAASYARPLLVTRVGGMATLLKDKESAVMVPPGDAPALADGIRWLVAHPAEAQELGRTAYALVKASYSVEAMVEQVLSVYDQVAR